MALCNELMNLSEKVSLHDLRISGLEKMSDAIFKQGELIAELNTSLHVLVNEVNNITKVTMENQEGLKMLYQKPGGEFSAIKVGIASGIVVGLAIAVFEKLL